MVPKRRRPPAHVDGHVEHPPAHHAYQLGLRMRRQLKVQASHHAVSRATLVVLHKPYRPAYSLVKVVFGIGFKK